jgi:hypothetical protein
VGSVVVTGMLMIVAKLAGASTGAIAARASPSLARGFQA